MDFNEIKNRAKDFLADRAEPREGQDDQAARRVDDDPAARTDPVRIDPDAAAGRASRDRADDRAGAITDEPVAGGPGPDRVDPEAERVAPEPERSARADRRPDPSRPRAAPATSPTPEPSARPIPTHAPAGASRRRRGPRPPTTRVGSAMRPRVRSRSAAATTPPGAAGELPADPERLVTAERADSYGARWREVQGEFVDEPRQAVVRRTRWSGAARRAGSAVRPAAPRHRAGPGPRRRVHRGAARRAASLPQLLRPAAVGLKPVSGHPRRRFSLVATAPAERSERYRAVGRRARSTSRADVRNVPWCRAS